jgi:hypothetical protein
MMKALWRRTGGNVLSPGRKAARLLRNSGENRFGLATARL